MRITGFNETDSVEVKRKETWNVKISPGRTAPFIRLEKALLWVLRSVGSGRIIYITGKSFSEPNSGACLYYGKGILSWWGLSTPALLTHLTKSALDWKFYYGVSARCRSANINMMSRKWPYILSYCTALDIVVFFSFPHIAITLLLPARYKWQIYFKFRGGRKRPEKEHTLS